MKLYLNIRRVLCGIVFMLFLTLVAPVNLTGAIENVYAAKSGLNYTTKTLLKGESFQLTVKKSKPVKYTSSNKKVAIVNQQGVVKAKKKGNAVIRVKLKNGKTLSCKVKVNSEVDLFIFAGQSNMTGAGGDTKSVALIDGAGYECKTITKPNTLSSITEPFGAGQDTELMNDAPHRLGTLVTAFANSYYKQTGTPIVGVSATAVGTNSGLWDRVFASEVIRRTQIAKKTLKKKGIKVRGCYLVFYQGEADAMDGFTTEEYTQNVTRFFKKLKSNVKVKKCFLIRIGYMQSNPLLFEDIVETQTELCKTNKNFVLVSTKAATLGKKNYRTDGLHLNQKGLDIVGKEAGKNAGKYVKTGKEPSFFDKKYNEKYEVSYKQ